MRTLWYDVRHGLRGLLGKPGFCVVILATVALGVGANVALFSVVNAVLLRPMGFRQPNRVVALEQLCPYCSVSEAEFEDYRRDAHSLRFLSAYSGEHVTLTGAGEPERALVLRATEDFFGAVGVAHPHIAGKTLALDGVVSTIVGVMPSGFDFPRPDISVWVPLRLNPDSLQTRNNHYLGVVGRLAPDATIGEARVQIATLAGRFALDFPGFYFPNKPLQTSVRTVRDAVVGDTRPYLLALLGAVTFVLLIASVNVANLLLVRGEGRRKEMAVRIALGASPKRLGRQLLTESALLALGGGLLGLAAAWCGVRVFVAAAPTSIPRLDGVRIDMAVLAFTLTITMCTGLLFGILPAALSVHGAPTRVLGAGGRSSAARAQRGVGRGLIVAEVALAVVTLASSGMLVRSLMRLQATDPGFDARHVLTMQVTLSHHQYTDERAVAFYRDLLDRVRGVRDVLAAGAVGDLPISGNNSGWSILVDGRVVQNIAEAPVAKPEQVTPDYFHVMSIPIVRGRAFTDGDRSDGQLVAVVNETMAKELWPGRDPVGHTIRMFSSGSPWATVVGVAGDVRSSGVDQAVPSTMYFPYAQAGKSAYFTPLEMTVVARTAADPLSPAGGVGRVVRDLDRSAPISGVTSMDAVLANSLASRRFTTLLLAAFAILALVLAGVGIYGVISFGVSERTYEMGLRQALGAQRRSLLVLILKEGVGMTAIGLAIGLIGASAVGQLIRSLLVGTSPNDGLTFTIVCATLVVVAIVASVLPGRRAMAVQPTEALRSG
jgi:putative ABC transport system permease protein